MKLELAGHLEWDERNGVRITKIMITGGKHNLRVIAIFVMSKNDLKMLVNMKGLDDK